jgi:hypothetical protein
MKIYTAQMQMFMHTKIDIGSYKVVNTQLSDPYKHRRHLSILHNISNITVYGNPFSDSLVVTFMTGIMDMPQKGLENCSLEVVGSLESVLINMNIH